MKSIVIYETRSGNTRQIAEVIAGVLASRGAVDLLPTEEGPAAFPEDTDLIVVGGPTEGRGMTRPMASFLDRLAPRALNAVPAAAFDTRLRLPRLLTGSAALGIARRLRAAGATLIVPEESFKVSRAPLLQKGELERAEAWAKLLADAIETHMPAAGAASR